MPESPSIPALHLAVALDGAGWHPAAWREPDARPRELFTARYWADLVAECERGLLDFVTLEDSLGPQQPYSPEPVHLSKAIATLDYISSGRAGVRVQVTASPEHAAHFGRRTIEAGPQLAG